MSALLGVLFLLSGVSGLIYQVIWVREFGFIFGNTVYSASLVVAIFMAGLGVGGYLGGVWADRRQHMAPAGLLRAYGALEGLIAALGLAVSLVLPRLGGVVAATSAYVPDANGWLVLSTSSYAVRGALALVLLTPITVAMGGTLTVLIRFVVGSALRRSGWAVAMLYGANTLGAAAGAFFTDFALVPALGLFGTQITAVALNALVGCAALALSWRGDATPSLQRAAQAVPPEEASRSGGDTVSAEVRWAAVALALSGFAALGFEILWLRHLGVMLGGFRAVFSLLLTVLLVALGAGAFLGGWLDRRYQRPALALMGVQALFALAALVGLLVPDAVTLTRRGTALAATVATMSPSSMALAELWYNLGPMLLEVGLPALVGGCAFPLANAIVQRVQQRVGRRAGALYAANTAGAVAGSLVTGYLLLPALGMQGAAAVLALAAGVAVVPLCLARGENERAHAWPVLGASGALVAIALVGWLLLPAGFLVQRALGPREANEQVLAISEGVNELLMVVEHEGRGRGLLTNGHAMSSTARLDQRYMRALAHIPLLSMEAPARVLVIGFGVGNTTHAATLHPSVTRVDVADLSRDILRHASYFEDANRGVQGSHKVQVHINDGRLHLQMVPPATYDLITLEPPPIAHAGVAALYSRDFYALARSRLKPGGYVSQWLPAYQVPADDSLAMARAFVEVFPEAVVLSGAQAELLLVGTTGGRLVIDPTQVAARMAAAPALEEDLSAIDLGTPREIAGTFVGSSDTLARATQGVIPVTDDRPSQEYGVRSRLTTALMGVPASLFELTALPSWCPGCYVGGEIAPVVDGLDLYQRLLQQAYVAPSGAADAAAAQATGTRRILGSAYLGAVVPDSAEVHNILGIAASRQGDGETAIREFEAALMRNPQLPSARANLGELRYEEGTSLLEAGRVAEAAARLRAAVELLPDSPEAHNALGVALKSAGSIDDAISQFTEALQLAPDYEDARRNLAAVYR